MRKIISSKVKKEEVVAVPQEEVKVERSSSRREESSDSSNSGIKAKKVCFFCESKTLPTYTDASTLRRFMSDRAKIVNHARTGACSKHQRRISTEIKHARHLALLPFAPKI